MKQMKKATLLTLILALCLSLCACSVKLTESQQAAVEKEDRFFNLLNKGSNTNVRSSKTELKKIDGKIVYIVTVDLYEITNLALYTFETRTMPDLQESLNPEDIYVVLYIKENGKEVYRMVDDKLDSSLLD